MEKGLDRAAALLLALTISLPVAAGHRESSIEILESIPAARGSERLEVWLNEAKGKAGDPERNRVVLGEEQRFHFVSPEEIYLTAVHVDSHGVATVLYPTTSPEDGKVAAGVEKVFPPFDIKATASPPLGREDLFVFGTKRPLTLGDLGLAGRSYAIFDEDEAPALAGRIRDTLGSHPAEAIVAARVELRVLGRATRDGSAEPNYTMNEIVRFFSGPRTRALTAVRLDVPIQFEFGAAELTDQAIADLEEFARAFGEPELADKHFSICGHTDDVGDEPSNMVLSRQRAMQVRDYLVKKKGIDERRFTIEAYGETDPKEPGHSDEVRRMNRRVEFELRKAD